MSVLCVYGAGGLGREVLELAKVINGRTSRWEVFAFVVDGDARGTVNGVDVYTYADAKGAFPAGFEVAVGIGEPEVRDGIFDKVLSDGIDTPCLVHPDVIIPETTTVGRGAIIQQGCFVSCNVRIGEQAYLQPHCNIGHDDVLGKGCMISGFANLAGNVTVGELAYVGLSACVKEGLHIGERTIVGMGSAVFRDVPPDVIALGNPARVYAKNEDHRVFGR